MAVSHFLVDRDDYRSVRVVGSAPIALEDGEVRLRVDAFGFTANNVTYAAAGDLVGYWNFFPAPDLGDGVRWGRVPVWGFADVAESRCAGVEPGERLFGYLPMSDELIITPDRVRAAGLQDAAPHRSGLPPVYNRYTRCAADPLHDPDREDEQMLYFPLFFTSFLIDDLLADSDFFGAGAVVLASASSKTAFGLAHLLHTRGGPSVVGLTSPRNVDFVAGLGCYDRVHAYDDVASLPDGPAALVDMSGDAGVVRSVHERYGDLLTVSLAVGITHWEGERAAGVAMPGPRQTWFFAPSRIEKRNGDWGPGVLESKLTEAWRPFAERAGGWVGVEHDRGPDAMARVYSEVLEGRTRPDVAHVLHP
jgi:hypothetical protein